VSGPFVAHNVAQRFLYATVANDPDVLAAVDKANIFPNEKPGASSVRQLSYTFAGRPYAAVGKPSRSAISQVMMLWDMTGWEPRYSQQALDPLLEAVMKVLIGAETRGKSHQYFDGTRSWGIDCDYVGPEPVSPDLDPAGVWSPVRERYQITVRPK
jgi:hypothetical protein